MSHWRTWTTSSAGNERALSLLGTQPLCCREASYKLDLPSDFPGAASSESPSIAISFGVPPASGEHGGPVGGASFPSAGEGADPFFESAGTQCCLRLSHKFDGGDARSPGIVGP